MTGAALAEMQGVTRAVGGRDIITRVSLRIAPAEAIALIGPNGAGKSTLIDILSGLVRPDEGSVYFDGVDIASRAPHRVARMGLVRTFQLGRTLPGLTVLENLMVAAPRQTGETLTGVLMHPLRRRTQEAALSATALDLLAELGLSHRAAVSPRTLSGGERRLVEIARAAMTKPRLLLLDEPFAGVDAAHTMRIVRFLEQLRGRGVSLVIAEHDLAAVASLADRAVALSMGQVVATGDWRRLGDDPAVKGLFPLSNWPG